jgi:hypothetical protein
METKTPCLISRIRSLGVFLESACGPRPAGCYVCTCRIPGNFLVEGSLVADVAITTVVPFEAHFS